jgi:hypothetical protein
MSSRVAKLETMVRFVMEKYPDTRNSDIRLMGMLWLHYYPEKIKQSHQGRHYVAIEDLYELPREDNIKRVRAHIQNDLKQLVPTSAEVAKKRGWNINEWKNYLHYATPGKASQEAFASNAELDKEADRKINDEKPAQGTLLDVPPAPPERRYH